MVMSYLDFLFIFFYSGSGTGANVSMLHFIAQLVRYLNVFNIIIILYALVV